MRRDPLADPKPLIRRVYAYVAYRVGDGAEAEDVTSETFERALRRRHTYDPSRGEPIQWLLGIARRCLSDAIAARELTLPELPERPSPENVAEGAVTRLELAAAIATLDPRDQDLIALRYGADLTARRIAEMLDMTTNSVEVALHRALNRLRGCLDPPEAATSGPAVRPDALPVEP